MLFLKRYIIFFKLSKKWKILSIFGIPMAVIFLSSDFSSIEKKIKKNPFFHVVAPKSEKIFTLKTKLTGLPGIRSIFLMSSEKLDEKIRSIMSEMGPSGQSLISGLPSHLTGLKIEISKDLSSSSRKLLKNYIQKLGGDDIEIGPVYRPKLNSFSLLVPILSFLKNHVYSTAFFLFLWLFCIYFSVKDERRAFFICHSYGQARSFLWGQYGLTWLLMASFYGLLMATLNYPWTQRHVMFLCLGFVFGLFFYFGERKWPRIS